MQSSECRTQNEGSLRSDFIIMLIYSDFYNLGEGVSPPSVLHSAFCVLHSKYKLLFQIPLDNFVLMR